MDPVIHFELPASDRNRMSDFYTKVFGWQTQLFGEEMNNYVTATTTETDKNGKPIMPGAINGGFYLKREDLPGKHPSIVISVLDIHESVKKVSKAGGNVIGEPIDIPGIGLYVSFFDTEGNLLSILQPVK